MNSFKVMQIAVKNGRLKCEPFRLNGFLIWTSQLSPENVFCAKNMQIDMTDKSRLTTILSYMKLQTKLRAIGS